MYDFFGPLLCNKSYFPSLVPDGRASALGATGLRPIAGGRAKLASCVGDPSSACTGSVKGRPNAEDPGWLLAAAWSQPCPKKRNAGQLRVPLPALMLDAYRLGDSGHLIIWARQNPISKLQDLYVCIAQCAGTQSNSDRLSVENSRDGRDR